MKPLTLEWIDKAERDYETMERESRVSKNPNPDAVCFHAQQCVEKYLKARLCEAGERVPKIHDLNALLDSRGFHHIADGASGKPIASNEHGDIGLGDN